MSGTTHPRPSGDALRALRMGRDVGNNFADACFEGRGYGFSKRSTVGRGFARSAVARFEYSTLMRGGMSDAASTSSSLATPLRSAPSIACNSSAVALVVGTVPALDLLCILGKLCLISLGPSLRALQHFFELADHGGHYSMSGAPARAGIGCHAAPTSRAGAYARP